MAKPRLINLGDSFAQLYRDERSYLRLVMSRLGMEAYPAELALGASSLDHLFMKQWETVKDDLREGDRIIVCLTSPDRTFFFKDNHKYCMLYCADPSCPWQVDESTVWTWSPQQREAFIQYYMHLHDDERNLRWLDSWFYQLDRRCAEIGTKAIVIDCFGSDGGTAAVPSTNHGNIIRAKGQMISVSGDEMVTDDWNNYLDIRLNHMMLCNHAILAEKIIAAYDTGALDLTTGFKVKCFSKKDAARKSWLEENVGMEIASSWQDMKRFGLGTE